MLESVRLGSHDGALSGLRGRRALRCHFTFGSGSEGEETGEGGGGDRRREAQSWLLARRPRAQGMREPNRTDVGPAFVEKGCYGVRTEAGARGGDCLSSSRCRKQAAMGRSAIVGS